MEHGFRLPSALDNRPLTFDEWTRRVGQVVFVSAHARALRARPEPGRGRRADHSSHRADRPGGRRPPGEGAGRRPAARDPGSGPSGRERVLVTTLTKRMAEDLTQFYQELGVKVRYLHSEVETLERVQILRDLRRGVFDVLVGINLLREGLDLPEVSLVAILDADKEGFLRSSGSLNPDLGPGRAQRQRACRHVRDVVTDSMRTRARRDEAAPFVAGGVQPGERVDAGIDRERHRRGADRGVRTGPLPRRRRFARPRRRSRPRPSSTPICSRWRRRCVRRRRTSSSSARRRCATRSRTLRSPGPGAVLTGAFSRPRGWGRFYGRPQGRAVAGCRCEIQWHSASEWALGSVVEHRLHTAGGQWFESTSAHHFLDARVDRPFSERYVLTPLQPASRMVQGSAPAVLFHARADSGTGSAARDGDLRRLPGRVRGASGVGPEGRGGLRRRPDAGAPRGRSPSTSSDWRATGPERVRPRCRGW